MVTLASPTISPPVGEKAGGLLPPQLAVVPSKFCRPWANPARLASPTTGAILEITMPLEDHEFAAELIGRFIYFLGRRKLGQRIKSMRSTTIEREDLNRSPEPDNAFYIKNQPQVAGRTVNFQEESPAGSGGGSGYHPLPTSTNSAFNAALGGA